MKYLFAVLLVLSGCTGTQVSTGPSQIFDGGSCDLRVFQTKGMALEQGLIKEVCVVKGSSAFSFNHTERGAIKKVKNKVCACGVEYAYIQSSTRESDMGFSGVSYITLVGFRYSGGQQ